MPYKYACEGAGISPSTLSKWLKLGRETDDPEDPYGIFYRAFNKAKAGAVIYRVESIRKAGEGGTWQAHAWWLERMAHEDFGRKSVIDANVNANVKQVDLSKLIVMVGNNKSLTEKDYKKVVNDLYLFYRVFVGSKFSENLPAPHIKKLSKELMRMTKGDYQRLCVSMPPRHSKSSMITIAYPMWRLFQNPNLNILIVNNSSSLSEKFGIELREYIREFGELFNVYLSDVKKSQSYLMFSDKDGRLYNGSIRLVGKGGAITGTSADILIIDDPIKGGEDMSPNSLEKLWDFYKTIILQRLEPHSELVILHTRWGTDDLIGKLKKHQPNDYKFIEYPAILDDGTPLWKERYSIEMLEHRRKESGDFFDLSHLRYGKPLGEPLFTVRAWDIASSDSSLGDARDYSVGVKMELYENDEVVITDIIRGQYGNSLKTVLQDTAKKDGLDCHIVVETGAGASARLLAEEYKTQLKGYIVEEAVPVKSKEDRATPFRNAIIDGKVYLDISDEQKRTLIRELNGFPYLLHDDQVDASSHGFNFLCRQDKGAKPDLIFIDF